MAKDNNNFKYCLILFITSIIWGLAFVAQSKGAGIMGAFSFNAIRTLLGALVLVPVIKFIEKKSNIKEDEISKKRVWQGGIYCGIFLFFASNLQQFGIMLGTSAGKAGFLTTTYIFIVPFISLIMFAKKLEIKTWISVIIALFGLYLLCITKSASLMFSDILVLLSALAFSFQILTVAKYAPRVNPVKLSSIQFFVSGIISLVMMILFDIIPIGFSFWLKTISSLDGWITILYSGILSSGLGYTLQIIGQRNVDATVASIIMSTESVFAAIGGWIILNQAMTSREIIGAVFVFIAIIITQVNIKIEKWK